MLRTLCVSWVLFDIWGYFKKLDGGIRNWLILVQKEFEICLWCFPNTFFMNLLKILPIAPDSVTDGGIPACWGYWAGLGSFPSDGIHSEMKREWADLTMTVQRGGRVKLQSNSRLQLPSPTDAEVVMIQQFSAWHLRVETWLEFWAKDLSLPSLLSQARSIKLNQK